MLSAGAFGHGVFKRSLLVLTVVLPFPFALPAAERQTQVNPCAAKTPSAEDAKKSKL